VALGCQRLPRHLVGLLGRHGASAGRHHRHLGATLKQDDGEPFETRLTFISPKGGVSRYPGSPCGHILAGGRKGQCQGARKR
jgi:hypothetical protein